MPSFLEEEEQVVYMSLGGYKNRFFGSGRARKQSWIPISIAMVWVGMGFSALGWSATPYNMVSGNYSCNFTDVANWANDFVSGTGASNWGSVVVNPTGTIPNGIKTTVASDTFKTSTSGGVQKGTGTLNLLSSGATANVNSVAVDLFLDFTGRNAGTLAFDYACVFNSTGDRGGSLKIYTSTDGSTWTELTSAMVSVVNNVVASGAKSALQLPASLNNSGTARIRFYQYADATLGSAGSRPKISIDNVAVTSTATPSVTASAATSVGATAATLNGNVAADGGATITERGFVYKTSPGVTITDNKTGVSGTTGAYTVELSSLTTGSTYYFKAYAVNSAGTTLSSPELSFTTGAVASPTITAAMVATVDAAFEVTFTDDSAWRSVITGITVGGENLRNAAYSVTDGKITFTPSASALLQSSETKIIVIKASGYLDASFNQILGVGQASKLVVKTQPAAPAFNGLVLAAQPVVGLQDQYGNATTSTANVTAAVGEGSWTLGGTATVAAVNGTVTFSGITATSTGAVTGATISFSSVNMAGATSSGFYLPAPLPPGEILISQVYAAGGNSGAIYNADYVEVYNPGTSDKDLTGWSIQYSSSTGTTWTPVQALSGTIKAKRYYLVSLNSGANGVALPTADCVGSVNLATASGKVALANSITPFTGAVPTGAVDFVGYGAANSFEGLSAAPVPSATKAIFRAGNGGTDSNNNGADFALADPNPRNSIYGEAVGTITLNPTSITNLTTAVGGVSAVQSYVVVGTNLGTTNLVVTPSLSLIQISTNASSGFSTNSIPFIPVGGVVSNTIYVRATNNTATNYSGTITNVSGLASASLPVSGTIYAVAEYYSMASGNYSETFSNIASWATPTTGSWQGLISGGASAIPVATNITTATLAFSSSSTTGVQKGTENLLFLTTGSTGNSTSIATDLLLNFTGRSAGTLSFNAATVFNSSGDRVSTLRVYTSINGTDWSDFTTGGLPFVSTNNVAGSNNISVSLPRAFDNAPQAQIRFYVYNGEGGTTGSRPKISIDNVAVTSTGVVNPEGSTFEEAYPGKIMTDIAPNGLSYLANYGFGGSEGVAPTLPIIDNSDLVKLKLIVVVRTNIGLGGETTTDLAGSWSASEVSVDPSPDTSPVPANTVRKVISVDRSGLKRFLRATITR